MDQHWLCTIATHYAPKWLACFISESSMASPEAPLIPDKTAHKHSSHHPGPGSRPMRWIVRGIAKLAVQSIVWSGRAGALHLRDEKLNMYVIGVHGGHADLLADSLSDVARLAAHRPYGSQMLMLGDWNVDQLPEQEWDPWAEEPARAMHHARERRWLQALTQACNVTLAMPEIVQSQPPGPWATDCFFTGITRVPIGGQVGLPSILDYAAATPGCISKVWGTWEGTCSDHAMIIAETTETLEKRRWTRTTWKCRSMLQCKAWMSEHGPSCQLGPPELAEWLLKAQQKWEDGKSSAQRRDTRIPDEVKQL